VWPDHFFPLCGTGKASGDILLALILQIPVLGIICSDKQQGLLTDARGIQFKFEFREI